MNNKKNTIITTFAIAVLIVALIGATYAYFSAQGGASTSKDVSVTSNTTDLLTFQVANDISFTASEANFFQGGNNVSGSTTATATLVPNNKTNQATMNYYMYLNLTSNPITYSSTNTNEDPELILQVFDENDQLVTLTGLGNQVSLGSGYGYDITGKSGVITLLNNHAITASGSTEVENWSIVITLVNLGVDQNDNTGKTVTGTVIMTKDSIEQDFCQSHSNDLMCYSMANYDATTYATGTSNLLYYHDENLEDGAEDGSYRYAGSNPNNWVCFGSEAATCPATNLYRIIGFMPVDVVTDLTTTPVTTERQMLYKLIKNDYATSEELGTQSNSYSQKMEDNPDYSIYSGPDYNYPTGLVEGFIWDNTSPDVTSWYDSFIYNVLNTNFLNSFGSSFVNKIANVKVKYSEMDEDFVYEEIPTSVVYNNEIGNNNMTSVERIGLMYVTDYLYSIPQTYWDTGDYLLASSGGLQYMWLYKGVYEWTKSQYFCIWDYGIIAQKWTDEAYGIRPTFYLTKDTTIDRTTHTGTQADPYRIS